MVALLLAERETTAGALETQSYSVYNLVTDFGADPTGQGDSTSAVQQFFDSVGDGDIGVIPMGTYSVRSTIQITNKAGMRISGQGAGRAGTTAFRWDGAPGGVVFAVNQVETSYLEHFAIESGSGSVGVCIDTDNIPPIVHISTQNRYIDVLCDGSTVAGFRISHQSMQNNDQHLFKDVIVNCSGGAGISIENGESKFDQVRDAVITGCARGIEITWGSAQVWNTKFIDNALDVYLGSPYDTVGIYHPTSVGAREFLKVDGRTDAAWPVLIEGGTFDTASIPSGGYAMEDLGPGPLLLMSNVFESSGSDADFSIYADTFISGAGVISVGNLYPDTQPFQGNGRFISLGDMSRTGRVAVLSAILTGPVLRQRP